MFRMKKEPEQGTNNTISLKCFLCQGNWTGTNTEELRKHLEKDHKVVFQIKELIELSKEPAATSDEEERLPAASEARVDTNSGERMSHFSLWMILIVSQVTPAQETPVHSSSSCQKRHKWQFSAPRRHLLLENENKKDNI